MKTAFDKALLLLAASGFSSKELTALWEGVRAMGASEFLARIHLIRDQFESPHSPSGASGESVRSAPPPPSGVGGKVARLLLIEAGLSAHMAVISLGRELEKRRIKVSIAFDPKRGFRAWVEKLAREVPEGELLFVATTIRNQFVHDRPSDWRLK